MAEKEHYESEGYKDPLSNALILCRKALESKVSELDDYARQSKKTIKELELSNTTLKQELDKVSSNHKKTIKELELSNTTLKQRPQEPDLKDPEVRSIEGRLFKQLLIRVGVKPPSDIPDTVSYDSQIVKELNLNKSQIKTIFKGA